MIDATQLRLDLDAPMNLNDAYWSAYFLRMHLAEGYETLIHKFRHKAITIALVTDQIAELQLKKIRILEIEKHFDYIVTSEECSGEKITLAPFELLISRIRSENLDCTWFIGDEKQDWPTALNLNKKVYFASPFSGRAPKYVRKIYSYKDLANEV
jgi:FMN phosphatase YigB (HAD superfamily)